MNIDLGKLSELFKEVEGVFAVEHDKTHDKINVYAQSRSTEQELIEIIKEDPKIKLNIICALPRRGK